MYIIYACAGLSRQVTAEVKSGRFSPPLPPPVPAPQVLRCSSTAIPPPCHSSGRAAHHNITFNFSIPSFTTNSPPKKTKAGRDILGLREATGSHPQTNQLLTFHQGRTINTATRSYIIVSKTASKAARNHDTDRESCPHPMSQANLYPPYISGGSYPFLSTRTSRNRKKTPHNKNKTSPSSLCLVQAMSSAKKRSHDDVVHTVNKTTCA